MAATKITTVVVAATIITTITVEEEAEAEATMGAETGTPTSRTRRTITSMNSRGCEKTRIMEAVLLGTAEKRAQKAIIMAVDMAVGTV